MITDENELSTAAYSHIDEEFEKDLNFDDLIDFNKLAASRSVLSSNAEINAHSG